MAKFDVKFKDIKLPNIYLADGKEYYLDPFRKKLILKTPEEVVRQRMLRYLVDTIKVPEIMLQVEMLLSKYGIDSKRRADIVIERYISDEEMISPLAVVECKAPDVMLGEDAINQVFDYAEKLDAVYIIVTNGMDLMVAKYDYENDAYIDLEKVPTYEEMLAGQGDILEIEPDKERFSFDELEINRNYYCGYEFNPNTPEGLRAFLTNLWECILDVSHKLPERKYKIFTVIKDYGIRYLSCGNAAGGAYQGAYRSFIIEYDGNTKFMNLGFFDYGTSTILTVSVDQDDHKSHNSLQYSVNQNLVKIGEVYYFYHSGRIAVGNIGSGKISELKQIIEKEYPTVIRNNKIHLGTIHNESLLYLDTPEVVEFVENLLSYSLIRDKYRDLVKKSVKK
ncbi:MAG: type I restriction enzyme HsdR N-terminal domain-containing protein [Eubacteriales bacterium]|nr:type I restriction enzyme HsdR N-terminal domain-containing protein [Eubacteriales bacterium]